MAEHVNTALISRRTVLMAGAASAGAVVLAGCMGEPDPPEARPGEVVAGRAPSVPANDPDARDWQHGQEREIALDSQIIALPSRLQPYVPSIRIRAIHDGSLIGFQITWPDAQPNDLTIATNSFRDACAVLLASGAGDQSLRTMGSAAQPATLLHWKADWQRDVDKGRQGIRDAYPNVVVDTYPPLGYPKLPVTPQTYIDAKATEWLPGLHVGNPLSAATRTVPVEKLLAHGFGSATTAATQNCAGRGVRTENGWRVVITKPMPAADDGELALQPGQSYTCAFAIWAGNEGDAGSRKSPSRAAWSLVLEA